MGLVALIALTLAAEAAWLAWTEDPGELRYWPFMVIRTGWLASNPVIVYHALAFYHAHPELRGELGTPDALARIGSGRAVGHESP